MAGREQRLGTAQAARQLHQLEQQSSDSSNEESKSKLNRRGSCRPLQPVGQAQMNHYNQHVHTFPYTRLSSSTHSIQLNTARSCQGLLRAL